MKRKGVVNERSNKSGCEQLQTTVAGETEQAMKDQQTHKQVPMRL